MHTRQSATCGSAVPAKRLTPAVTWLPAALALSCLSMWGLYLAYTSGPASPPAHAQRSGGSVRAYRAALNMNVTGGHDPARASPVT